MPGFAFTHVRLISDPTLLGQNPQRDTIRGDCQRGMGKKALTFGVFQRAYPFYLGVTAEIEAGRVLQNQNEGILSDPIQRGPALALNDPGRITGGIIEKAVSGFGSRQVPAKFRDRCGWVLGKVSNYLTQSVFQPFFAKIYIFCFLGNPVCDIVRQFQFEMAFPKRR